MAYQLTNLGGGTYGAEDAGSGQAVAFSTEQDAKSFLGTDAIDYSKAVNPTLNYQQALANPNKAISVAALTPAASLTVPQAQPQPDSLAPTIAGAQATSKSLDQYIKELTPPETKESKQYDTLFQEINTLLPGLGGRGETQLKAETDAGLPQLKKTLADLNAQMLAKIAEGNQISSQYEQIATALENQSIPTNIVMGQQAQVRRQQLAEANTKSAEIGLLQARALGVQGNLEAAQSTIDRAIDLMYRDRESTLEIKTQQLAYLKDALNRGDEIFRTAASRKFEDERIADERNYQERIIKLERQYNEERERIAEEKAKSKEKINLAFSANVQTPLMNVGGEWTRTSDGKTYKDPAELFKDFPQLKNDFNQAYKMGLVTDVSSSRLADIEYVQQLRAKYSDAGITLTDTAGSAEQKVSQNSKIYREEIRPPQSSTSNPYSLFGPIKATDTDIRVAQILQANPGEYGNAADQIDREFGKGTATVYDSWLKSVYLSGQPVTSLTPLGGSPAKQASDAQNTASLYANRMVEANEVINKQTDVLAKYNPVKFGVDTKLPSSLQSSTVQQQLQAERNFVNAVLRRESGAAISESEFDSAKLQYFPRPGDSKETLAQKAQNRQTAIDGIIQSAGVAYNKPATNNQSSGTTVMTGPDGSQWVVPNDKVEVFKQNGYK